MGKIYLDIFNRVDGPRLARLGAPALTWAEFDELMASIKDGSYCAPVQAVTSVAPTPAPSVAPHVGLPAIVTELEMYRA